MLQIDNNNVAVQFVRKAKQRKKNSRAKIKIEKKAQVFSNF